MINAATHSATLEDVPQLVRMMEEFYDEAGFPLDHGRASDGFSALLAVPVSDPVVDVHEARLRGAEDCVHRWSP